MSPHAQNPLLTWNLRAPLSLVSHSVEETWQIAYSFTQILPADQILALSGDLGAGKTAFVKGLAKAWGITEPITSPTFSLMNIHQGTRQLVHIDAYRLDSASAWDSLMVEDFLQSPWCVAIEWPSKIQGAWSGPTWNIQLSRDPQGTHQLVFNPPTEA
jgi:tRNA threonylcarbamoyladenosine biosynthesis protein TsaE